jgi:hypothetical protein
MIGGALRKARAILQPVQAGRERMRQAMKELPAAQARLDEADAAIERAKSIIDGVASAEAAALAAEKAAAESAQEWAEAGARADAPIGNRALLDAATEAQRRVSEAQIKARGAEAGLPALFEQRRKAEAAHSGVKSQIWQEIGDLLMANAEQDFACLERAQEATAEAFARIRGLEHFARYIGTYHFDGSSRPHISFSIQDRLAASTKHREPKEEELWARCGVLADYARRLAADPDALLDSD